MGNELTTTYCIITKIEKNKRQRDRESETDRLWSKTNWNGRSRKGEWRLPSM